MLHKEPKNRGKLGRTILISAVAFETVLFCGSYYIWHRTNNERDFRNYLRLNHPTVLEFFYRTNEYMNSTNKTRELDRAYWQDK